MLRDVAAIDEGIVREYFEQNGFFVRQVRKHAVQARKKTSDEEIDLVVYNPRWNRESRKPDFFLFATELPCLHRAIVAVKPWHTDVFTPGMLKSSPEIFRFLEAEVQRGAARFFPPDEGEGVEGAEAFSKILVLPTLPTQEPFRSQSVELLKARGVDGIISFRAILLDLIDKVEINRSYRKSDTLEVLRILKNYDLLREPQLDFLPARPGR
ncbi:MAG: hypothetical protein RL376_486 [Verrucomicrobiota bacterium]